MANAFSVQANYGDYIQPINTELVNFVLTSKQQKYDYNVAKIDETIAEFGIDLERESDKDYVIQKLNGVLDSVNNMGKMDLSNGNITRNIQQQIRGTLDEKMINAAKSTKNYRAFQGSLMQAKKDGTYSDINAGYAMERGGVSTWLNDGTDTLDSVSYTPYQDVNARVTKDIKQLKEFNPERTIDIPWQDKSGVNRIVSKKVKDLNEAELRSYVMSNLDENSQKQLQINGWAKFKGASDEDLSNYAQSFKTGKAKQYETNIALLKKQLNDAPPYMAQDIRDRINVLESEKSSFAATMENIGTDRDNIGRVIMQEQLVDDVSRAYADTSVSYELKSDTAYYEKAKLDFKKIELLTKNSNKKQEGSGIYENPQIRTTTTPVEHEDSLDPTKTVADFITTKENETNVIARGIVKGFDQETKKIYDELRRANPDKNEAEVLESMNLNSTYVGEDGEERFFKQAMNELKDVYEEQTEAYENSMTNIFEENISDVYREITSEGWANVNEFPLVQEDGSIVRMDTYLKDNGISEDDFRSNKDGVQDKVKKSLFLNKAISELKAKANTPVVTGRGTMPDTSNRGYLLDKNAINKVNKYLEVSDSEDTIFNYYDFVDTSTGQKISEADVENLDDSRGFILRPKNQMVKSLEDSMRGNSVYADRRVADEGRLSKIISFDSENFNNTLQKNLRERSGQNLIIDPNIGKGGKEIDAIHLKLQNIANTRGMAEPAKDKPFIISRTNDPNQLLVSQNDKDSQPVLVPKSEIEAIVGDRLADSEGSQLTVNREVINRDISPVNTSKAAGMKQEEILRGMMQRGEVLPSVISKNDLRTSVMNSSVKGYKYDSGELSPAGELSDYIIESGFDNLSVKYVPRGKGGIVTVVRKDTDEEIESYPVNPSYVTPTRNTVRYNPQLYIQKLLTNMVTSFGEQRDKSELFNKLMQAQTKDGGQ